ncbi:hypothetical protein [Amycolatopsis alkalitolerans]|uniref:Uncharacterized protein n=1 Tax=Amycolatopsis alkalitolerans TaxID=2547244 RepID=A0A5C4LT32_9PSEU|nr:hypothetical protein [Amycolatopsis alkalitolerans]TNC22218.1 hypothetical protein FG385_25915 [Amycolatopsis alkalitolerans]
MDLALPRRLSRFARTTFKAVQSLPRLTTVLTELRDAVKQLERLATFAAEELTEVVYQLERVREQLAEIERRMPGAAGSRNGEVTRTGPRRSASPE